MNKREVAHTSEDQMEIAGIVYTFDRYDHPLPPHEREGRGTLTAVNFATPKIYRSADGKEFSVIPGTTKWIVEID